MIKLLNHSNEYYKKFSLQNPDHHDLTNFTSIRCTRIDDDRYSMRIFYSSFFLHS